MKKYTEENTIRCFEEALKDIDNLYNSRVCNRKGKTKDTGVYYTEIIAKKLLDNIEVFNAIKPLIRKKSYNANHTGQQGPDTLRKEEILAKHMFNKYYTNLGEVIDYQVPTGKRKKCIDLLVKTDEGILSIVELKHINNEKETLLRSVLEIETYYHALNIKKLYDDFKISVSKDVQKAVLVGNNGFQHNEYKDHPEVRKLMKELNINMYVYEGDKENIQIQKIN